MNIAVDRPRGDQVRQPKTRGSAVERYSIDTSADRVRSRIQVLVVEGGRLRRIAGAEGEVQPRERPGAIGLRELNLTPEQATVVVGIIENRTAVSPRPARTFLAGDDSLLR